MVTAFDVGGSAGVPGEWDGEWAAVGDCAVRVELSLLKERTSHNGGNVTLQQRFKNDD